MASVEGLVSVDIMLGASIILHVAAAEVKDVIRDSGTV